MAEAEAPLVAARGIDAIGPVAPLPAGTAMPCSSCKALPRRALSPREVRSCSLKMATSDASFDCSS